MRWKDGSGRGATPFAVAGGLRGTRKRGPLPGDAGGSRWAFVRARYHGLLRLAPILRVSVARVRQVYVVPVGVSDRQALSGCVAQPRVVGLYKGVLLGGVGSPGVVAVYGRVRSRWCDVHRLAPWWEEASSQPSRRLLPCAWPARDSCRASVAVCRCCGSCGRVRLRVLGVLHASHKGAAEGTKDFVHKGRACRPGLRRSADGRLPSFAQRQRPDLVDCGVRQHFCGHQLGRGPHVYGWPLCSVPPGSCKGELRTGQDKVDFFCGPLQLAGSGLQQLCLNFVCVHDIAPYKLCAVVRRRCRLFGHCRTRARTDLCIVFFLRSTDFYYKKI